MPASQLPAGSYAIASTVKGKGSLLLDPIETQLIYLGTTVSVVRSIAMAVLGLPLKTELMRQLNERLVKSSLVHWCICWSEAG